MITALFSKVWGYIAAAGVLLAGVAAFWFKAKSEGADQEKAKQTEKIHEKVKDADKARRDQRGSGKRDRVSKFDRK